MFIQVGFCWGCTLLSFGFLVYPHHRRKIQTRSCLLLGSFKAHRTDAGVCFVCDLWTALVAPELHITRDKCMAASHLLQRTFNWREIPHEEPPVWLLLIFFHLLVMPRAFPRDWQQWSCCLYWRCVWGSSSCTVSACFSFPLITVPSNKIDMLF